MQNELHLSDALVDYSGISKTINDIQGRFSLLQFLDFCSLAEGIILHDRLIIIGSQKIPDKWEAALKPLLDHQVLVPEPQNSRPIVIKDRPEAYRGRATRMGFSLEDARYETGRLLGAEKQYHRPALALLRQKPFYEKSAFTIEEHSICNLIGKYHQLSEALEAMRKQSRMPIQAYITAPIPPIPLLVLKRSKKPEDLVLSALSVRDEFESLRTSMRLLREDLADPKTPPKQKLRAILSWEKSWKTLEHYNEQSSLVEIAAASNNLIDVAETIGNIGLDSVQWSNLIERLITEFSQAFYKWRVRVLHKAAKMYLQTSDYSLNQEVQRVFGYEIRHQDLDILREVGLEV